MKMIKKLSAGLQELAKTVLYFWSEKEIYAIIGIADAIKPTSRGAIERLKKSGLENTYAYRR